MLAPLVTALALAAGPGSQALVSSRDSLGVLNGLAVVVDVDDPAHVAASDPRALASRIEGALRAKGIHVYQHAGNRPAKSAGTPGTEGQLKLEVVAIQGTTGPGAQAVLRYDVGISQWVRLEADDASTAFARTWTQGGVLAAPAAGAPALLRQAVDEAVEQLCRDYASARAFWLARQRAASAEQAESP